MATDLSMALAPNGLKLVSMDKRGSVAGDKRGSGSRPGTVEKDESVHPSVRSTNYLWL